MALNSDLMNTQTGGEGETVQIQTQEQITPEQFDVKIKAQETPIDSEQQVIPTQQPTEPPVQPPVQREGMVEVQGAPPSEFVEAQETFNEVPVELPVVDPAQIVYEDPYFLPFVDTSAKPEESEVLPFVDTSANSRSSIDDSIKQFKSTESQINQDLTKSDLGQVVKLYDENKERGDGIFGKIKGFFKKEDKEEPIEKPVNVSGIQLTEIKGDQISEEDFIAFGGDASDMKIPTPDPTKSIQENVTTDQVLTFEETIAKEDLTGVINKGEKLAQFDALIEEQRKIKEQIKTAQGEELKSLRNNLKAIKGTLNDLKKSDDFKEQKNEYDQRTLKKGALPADYYSKQEANIYKPVAPDLTYHPSNYWIKNPFKNVGSQIFSRVIDKVAKEGGDDALVRAKLWTDSSGKFSDPDDLLRELFIQKDIKDLDKAIPVKGNETGYTYRQYAQDKIKSILMGYETTYLLGSGDDKYNEKIRPSLTYEEALSLDKFFRKLANEAKSNGGKNKDGTLKAVLFPSNGVLVPVTVELPDKNGNPRTVTLFSDIYDTEKNRAEVRNNFGMPWNKASFQYRGAEIISSQSMPYYVPDALLKKWESTVPRFSIKVFKQQQDLARRKDKDGKPYLQSDAGIFGVGITGVLDNETRDAQKRYEADLNARRARSQKRGAITDLKGESETNVKKTFWETIGLRSPREGDTYTIESSPIYQWKTTGKATGSYGGIDVSKIPLNKITTTEEAIIWAKSHLPTAKKLTFNDVNIFQKSEEDFKSYIEGLGTGVTVEEGGGLFNWDYVTIYPPEGVIATPIEIDLGVNNYELNKNYLETLSNWMKYAQKDPQADFIRDWTANFDQDNFLSSQIVKDISLKNNINYSGKNKEGVKINITSVDGRSKLDDYANAIKLEQDDLLKTKEQVDQKIGKYNAQIQPYVDQFQKIQDESNKQVALLEKQLDELDYKRNNNNISDEEFSRSSKTINDKIIALQNNLSNSYNQLQKAVGGNKELLNEINNDYLDVQERSSDLKIISDDINELTGIQTAIAGSDYQGPSTVVGSIFSSVYQGFLQPFITTISAGSDLLIQAGIYPEGMTKEEAIKMNNEWKANFLYGELSKSILNTMGLYKSPVYQSKEGFIMQSLSGLGESIGTQLNPLVKLFKGTPLEGVTSFMGFASMSYNHMEKEILTNPNLKDIPEYQKKSISIPYAIGMGLVEKYGYGKVLGGEKSAITQRLMVSTINQALKRLPKNASLEAIEAVIKADVKGALPKILRAAHSAGVVEFETESLQAAYEIGLQETADLLFKLEAFNTGNTFEDYMKTIAVNGASGYIGGAIMGGALRTTERIKTGKLDTIDPQDYTFFKTVASDERLKKLFSEKVANKFISGEIDKAEAERTMLNFENLIALDRKVSDQIEGEDRVKMVNLMLQKQKIQERMSELDESQKAIPNPALEIIDKQISEIVTRTETKVKEQQQYDQENETGIPGEIREGQEPITTQPVTEPGQEEVSPGGMVQEEQAEVTPTEGITTETQVTPTEEVVTETETTPTEPQKITSVMTTGEAQVESDLIGQQVSTGKQLKTADIQTGEMTSEFREDKNPTKGTVVNVEADPKNKNIERLILEDGTVLNRNKNTGAITLNNKVKATTKETEVKTETAVTNEFDELADINKLPLAKRTKAKNAFSEKYGDKADKIIKIDSNFTSIVSKLESANLITKKNC